MSTLSRPPRIKSNIRRVAILFAGGPAPAANAVISTAGASFLRNGIEVVGIRYGYSNLVRYTPSQPLAEGRDYLEITERTLKRTRNSQGILIGTSRNNPGSKVEHPSHLSDPERTAPLRAVYDALCSIGVDALISIGGDDTLKTANKFKLFQEHLPRECPRIPVVHLPKTIDNDYTGIDFTFGYFTAVEQLASEIRNLLADAEATACYFLVESMGRSAGWLAYGAAIAGEASLAISVEDITEEYLTSETYQDQESGQTLTRPIMNMDEVVGRIVQTMRVREDADKPFGVIVMAEGLGELLPLKYLKDISRDPHGHIAVGQADVGRIFGELVAAEYRRQTGRARRVRPMQLGYELRCARPHAFDVMLGSQLGVGAYRALVERGLNGVMVSVHGQLELRFVPFEELVDAETLVTVVRHVGLDSDFHKLVRFLETYVGEKKA